MKWLLFLLITFSCTHKEMESFHPEKDIAAKMTTPEKYKLLRSYRFLQTLSSSAPGRMPIAHGYLPGIPRLGIPSIEFIGTDRNTRQLAYEEKTLKLGFVSLIRDQEKTQVFGNFEEAGRVDSILSPEREKDIRSVTGEGELKDLDLYLVQEGSKERVRHYVCAQYREKDEFNCVSPRLELILQELDLAENYDSLLLQEGLKQQDLDRIVMEVLSTMNELKIL